MANWSDAFSLISGATDPQAVQNMQFDTPSLWDVYGTRSAGQYDPIAIEQFKKQKIADLQQKQALPTEQKLADFAAQGWSSDPNFTGKEWTEGLLTTPAFSGTDKAPDMSNPYVAKSVNDFAKGAQNTNLMSNVLNNPTPQNVAQMIQTNPEHFASNVKQATSLLDGPDTDTPALRDFTTGVMEDFSNAPDLNNFIKKAAGRLASTKADPKQAASLIENLSKNFATEKEPTSTEGNYRKGLEAEFISKGMPPEKARFEAARQVRKENALAQIQKIQTTIKLHDESKTRNLQINGLTPEENDAIATAIADRKLDPYRVNSRNQKMLAQTILKNPNVDLNAIAAEMTTARNKDVIMKSGIAEMIPGLLKETVQAGKRLKYSDAQFAGKIQRWAKGQLNDPKLSEYMTLRNDQLLTLGGVMRSNGMTDIAQRLEEEAASPTMSPRALEGWLEGQLKSIDPRLSLYRKLTKGNTAIPRSTYQPGQGAKGLLGTESNNTNIAPAGTRAKLKDGRIVTSDGKGGWK